MLKRPTTKLFYNKWCYKISLFDDNIKRIGNNLRFGQVIIRQGEKNTLNVLISKYYFRDDLKFRFEGRDCQIYLSDEKLYQEIVTELNQWIYEVHEPENIEERQFLFDNKRKILCSKLPKGKFNFKITLKNNVKWSVEDKKNFRNWLLASYKEKISISGCSDRWLKNEQRYVQDPFFYVQDEGICSMIGLYISDKIKKIEQFILKDKLSDLA